MQLVNLLEGGQRAQMSKRQGTIVPLDELIDDIGVDAARYFLLQRNHDTTIDLDLELARRDTQDNPVYYLQYAHARIASILRKAGREEAGEPRDRRKSCTPPSARSSRSCSSSRPRSSRPPSAARPTASRSTCTRPRRTSRPSTATARSSAHPNEEFRIGLCVITKRVLARGLDLLGVEAPEEM